MATRMAVLTACLVALVAGSAAAECDFQPDCRPGETRRVAIPCEGKCANFILCEDGIATEKKCGKFLWHQKEFDPELLDCVQNTDCSWWTRVTTTTTTTTTTAAPTTDSPPTSPEPTTTSTTAQPSSTSTATPGTEPPPPAAPTTPATPDTTPPASAAATSSAVTSLVLTALAALLL